MERQVATLDANIARYLAELEAADATKAGEAGYSNGEQLANSAKAGITAFVPPKSTSNKQGDGGGFQKSDFALGAEQDSYRCPTGESLKRKQIMKKERAVIYTTTFCPACSLKPRRTDSRLRHVSRHFDVAVLALAEAR